MPDVFVMVSDAELSRAVARWARHTLPGTAVEVALPSRALRASDVVITTEGDCTTFRCAEFVQTGVAVIVLAAVPRPSSELHYRAAGAAAYLPMSLDTRPIAQAITVRPNRAA